MNLKLVSMAVAVMMSVTCLLTIVSVDGTADGIADTSNNDGFVSMEEYHRMMEYAAAEVESELGIPYEDYCSYVEELQGCIVYVYYENGATAVDIVKSIDAGRTGFEWSGNGFDIYLDTLVMTGGSSAIIGAITGAMNPVAGLIASTVAAVALQFYSENYCPNGVVLYYNCYWTVNTPFGSFDVYHSPYLEQVGAQ